MNQESHRCKGMRDMTPADTALFRYVEEKFRQSCHRWGYQEIRTPVVEYLHLFTATGTLTPTKLSQVYSFLDWDGWSGERVVLRPDSTIPAARLYVDNMSRIAEARLYYVQNVFSFEPTGRESREKWQCGAEFIGGKTPLADAEIILMAIDILKTLKIKNIEIQLSHAGLIRALLGEMESDPAKQIELFDCILDGNTEGLGWKRSERSRLNEVLTLLLNSSGRADGFLRNVKATAAASLPAMKRAMEDFTRIVELLSPINGNFKLNLSSGRGFEYYTGIMFQFNSAGIRIGGGGRYDGLIPLIGGRQTPACGFALYLDRLSHMVKLPTSKKGDGTRIMVCPVKSSNAMIVAGFSLCQRLRDMGYTAILEIAKNKAAEYKYVIYMESERDTINFLLSEKGGRTRMKFNSANDLVGELIKRGKVSPA